MFAAGYDPLHSPYFGVKQHRYYGELVFTVHTKQENKMNDIIPTDKRDHKTSI